MKILYTRKCKCCGISFQTNRLDQFYVDRKHQVDYNNKLSSILRRKLAEKNKRIIKSYRIYDQLLGDKLEIRVSQEFLKGKGADLTVLTSLKNVKGELIPVLFDILFIKDKDFIKLLKL